jgi:hypothetical protein
MKQLRKSIKYIFPVLAVILLVALILSRVYRPSTALNPEGTIEAQDASEYIGKIMEVCGTVNSSDFRNDIGGKPTFLNFGRPYPDQYFTVVIWGDHLHKWQYSPHTYYSGRFICVTGRIEQHENTPQINVNSPDQISISS